jgi:membrane protein implicated in regulation of membrane protease activity
MRKLLIILGLIAAVFAVILSVLPLSNLAFIPAIVALLIGVGALLIRKKIGQSKKVIQLIFLLTIIALALATYKSIFDVAEVGDTQELEQRVEESVEDSKEILEDIEIVE